MSTIVFEAFAYLPKYIDLSDVKSGKSLPSIEINKNDEWYAKEGYPMIGSVTVTLTLDSNEKIVQGQIEALNSQLQQERADSQVRQNAILNQISKLQALTFDAQEAV